MTHNPDSNITMPCGTVHAARSVTGWSFDIEAIPRGRYEPRSRTVKVKDVDQEQQYSVFVPEVIWALTPGRDVVQTWFIPSTSRVDPDRWANMNSKHVPVAWHPFSKPAPPAGHMAQPISPDLIPIIDDVGSGE